MGTNLAQGAPVNSARWVRTGLWVLTVGQLGVGGTALLAPRTFFSINVVSEFPPYNEHLIRDFGALNLALAAILLMAAARPDRRLVQAALVSYLVYNVIHFVFHATHLAGFPAGLAVLQTIGTAIVVVVPALLLWLARRLPATRTAEPTGAGPRERPAFVADSHSGRTPAE